MCVDFSSLSDLELFPLCGSSDVALEAMVERHARLVRICARPYFLVGGDHEDLMQEGMIGLLTAIRQYRPDSENTFRTFAVVCIRNRLISAVRAAAACKHLPLNEAVSSFPQIPDKPTQSDPEALYIGKESFAEFLTALENLLSGFEKQILKLYLDGLSTSEIAALLHKPTKSVDNAVQRLRKKAAQLLTWRKR